MDAIEGSSNTEGPPAETPEQTPSQSDAPAEVPSQRLSTTTRPTSPIGSIQASLSEAQKAREAELRDLEARLADTENRAVQQIDTDLIDASNIRDRVDSPDADIQELAESIAQQGQKIPILVRPSPKTSGRFEIVYGRRRLAALRRIGRSALALVEELDDTQLLIWQGQENTARQNLSFIDQAMFAMRMEKAGYDTDIIATTLSCKAVQISRYRRVYESIPEFIIELIGSAHGVGRNVWTDFADRVIETKNIEKHESDIRSIAESPEFQKALGPDRINIIIALINRIQSKHKNNDSFNESDAADMKELATRLYGSMEENTSSHDRKTHKRVRKRRRVKDPESFGVLDMKISPVTLSMSFTGEDQNFRSWLFENADTVMKEIIRLYDGNASSASSQSVTDDDDPDSSGETETSKGGTHLKE